MRAADKIILVITFFLRAGIFRHDGSVTINFQNPELAGTQISTAPGIMLPVKASYLP
jgi:hypothetical protein